MPILQTIGLEKRFGGILAAQSVNLAVEPGARHALIGPNGAGKTTVINLLTGVLRPAAGRIELEELRVVRRERSRLGERGPGHGRKPSRTPGAPSGREAGPVPVQPHEPLASRPSPSS